MVDLPELRITTYVDGTPLREWTCPRCETRKAATGKGLAYALFDAHWKSKDCNRALRALYEAEHS